MENKKNIIVSIFLLILVGAVGYLLISKLSKSLDEAIPPVIGGTPSIPERDTTIYQHENTNNEKVIVDTSSWKTYDNKKYGLQFKYPQDYVIQEADPGFESLMDLSIYTKEDYDMWIIKKAPGDGPSSGFGFSIVSNPKNLSPLEWAKANDRESNFGNGDYTPTVVDGEQAITYTREGLWTFNVTVIKKDKIMLVVYVTDPSSIFAGILPTFKFTKSTPPVAFSQCLPVDIKTSNVVRVGVTVEQELKKLGALCLNGKLVDSLKKEIYFYHLTGCWGNPPYNYNEILQNQQEEISKLKEEYTVVEMTCNPSGAPIP